MKFSQLPGTVRHLAIAIFPKSCIIIGLMVSFERQHPEVTKSSENIEITVKTLLDDNHSQNADTLRKKWTENKVAGKHILLDACGDARVRFPEPEKYVTLKSIAAGGHIDNMIIKNSGIEIAVAASHYDGEAFIAGQMPTGCGGLGAKDKSLKNKKATIPIKGIHYYIEKRVRHPDPLIQSILSANKISKEGKVPSLVIAQDHRIEKIHPILALLPGKRPISAVNLIDLFSEYNPQEIYEAGIPELENSSIPDIFQPFIESCDAQVKELLLNFPNLKEIQRVQNPRMIILSTEIMSAKIRYPKIASALGILFKLHLPRIRNEKGKTSINPELLNEICCQMEYPIQFAVDNFGKLNESFSKADRVLIETEDIELSKMVTTKFVEEGPMKKWMTLEDHQILIVQTEQGITQLIEPFI